MNYLRVAIDRESRRTGSTWRCDAFEEGFGEGDVPLPGEGRGAAREDPAGRGGLDRQNGFWFDMQEFTMEQ